MKVLKVLGLIAAGLAGLAALAAVLGLVVMWLWNWLMPVLFGLPRVSFLQAVGLLVLCHLLFRGHSMGRHARRVGPRGLKGRDEFLRRVRAHLGRHTVPAGDREAVPAP
jgi:hypothetical protein